MIEGLFQPMHLLVIAGIALLVFGPSRLPELGRGFGQAIRGFKAGLEEIAAPRPLAPPELPAEAQAPSDPVSRGDPDPQGAANGSLTLARAGSGSAHADRDDLRGDSPLVSAAK